MPLYCLSPCYFLYDLHELGSLYPINYTFILMMVMLELLELDELELKEFLASDDGESDDDDEIDDAEASPKNSSQKPNKRDIYRALLQSGDG